MSDAPQHKYQPNETESPIETEDEAAPEPVPKHVPYVVPPMNPNYGAPEPKSGKRAFAAMLDQVGNCPKVFGWPGWSYILE